MTSMGTAADALRRLVPASLAEIPALSEKWSPTRCSR